MTECASVECIDTLASAPPAETYTYAPLKQASSIRLLRLLPGDKGDPIACHMVHADIEEQPVYSAISYAWGDETQRVTILCDNTYVSITKSLAGALQCFRPRSDFKLQQRQLWADAICINQQDNQEREQQIKIMAKIYARAESVLIWLGDEFDGLYTAIEYMEELRHKFRHRYGELIAWKPPYDLADRGREQRSAAINRDFGIKLADAPEYRALNLLFGRTWFERAWTFQESWLAQERIIYCGGECISGILMEFVLVILVSLKDHTHDDRYFEERRGPSAGMLQGPNEFNGVPKKRKMVELLFVRRGALCKNPSDLVYSLMGVAADGEQINVSYSVSWQQVFAEVVAHEIITAQTLCVFRYIQASCPDLPTWIPDWRSSYPEARRWFSSESGDLYRSSGATKPVISFTADGTLLTLRGYVLDVIATLTEYEHVELLEKQVTLPSGNYMYTNDIWATAVFRCGCADRRFNEDSTSVVRWSPATADEWINGIKEQGGSVYAPLIHALQNLNCNCSFMATKAGRLGVVPKQARTGDLVCLMAGGEVPLILRPKGEQFELIGESYVHGFMDGECFDVEAELVESWHMLDDETKLANDVLRQLRDFVLC